MKLRIIAGVLGRRYITVEKGAQNFRPTQERIRQAVAETLNPRIPGALAADVCAGSGAMGIELASRGAASVHFVENNPARVRGIARQCAALGIDSHCRMYALDAARFCRESNGGYHIIFFDPPYDIAALSALVPDLCRLLSPQGVLAYERAKKAAPQGERLAVDGYEVDTRVYGDTAVEFIKKKRGSGSE